MKINKSKAEPVSSWCYQRQTGSMKALQRAVCSLIFLVFGVRMAKVEEPEIQAQKMSEKDLYLISRVDVRWKRMPSQATCEWKWMREFFAEEEKEKRNSQGKDPRIFPGNSQGKDTRTFQVRCHKEERWRFQEKKKEGRWKRRRKKRRKR